MSKSELIKFQANNNIVLGLCDSPIGQIYAVVSGSYNPACPFECMAIRELLLAANGA